MVPIPKKRTLDRNTGDPSVITLNFMLDVCKWMKYFMQATLDVDSMKSLFSKWAVVSLTMLLLWTNMYLVGNSDISNIDNGNGMTLVEEDRKSYRVV